MTTHRFPPPPDKVEYYDFYYSPKMAEHADFSPHIWPYINYFNDRRYTIAVKTGQEAKCTWPDLVPLGTGTMKECKHVQRYTPSTSGFSVQLWIPPSFR